MAEGRYEEGDPAGSGAYQYVPVGSDNSQSALGPDAWIRDWRVTRIERATGRCCHEDRPCMGWSSERTGSALQGVAMQVTEFLVDPQIQSGCSLWHVARMSSVLVLRRYEESSSRSREMMVVD